MQEPLKIALMNYALFLEYHVIAAKALNYKELAKARRIGLGCL